MDDNSAESLPPGYDRTGLFFSSLDSYKQVKSEGTVICSCRSPSCPHTHYQNEDGTHGPWETPIPSRRETLFRHGGWLPKRARVAAALERAEVPIARRQRFACCGASQFVEINEETGEARLCGFYCGDRFCDPCGAARGVRARRAIETLLGGRSSWMVTVTQRGRSISCKEALNTLNARLKKLRASETWKKAFDGGVGVTEIKVGSGSGEWHVHQHMICTGRGLTEEALADAWFEATGDSFIVDVDEVRSPERAGGYVAKYITKGFDSTLLRDPVRLSECIAAISGRRLLVTFGDWYNALRSPDVPAVGRWRVAGGLDGLLSRADAGDEWASGVIWCIRRKKGDAALLESGDPLEFVRGGEGERGDGS